MKRISRLLPRSVFARFSTAFLLFGLLPLLVIMLFSLSRFSATMEEDTISRTRQMVSLVASNFETSFQRLASITEKMYLYDSENYGRLPDILLRNEDPSAIMRDYVEMLCDSYDTLCNVIFYDLVNDAVYAAGYPSTKALEQDYDFSKCDYVKKALANPRDLTISSPHAEDYYIFSDATVITLCRSLLSLDDLPERERILAF